MPKKTKSTRPTFTRVQQRHPLTLNPNDKEDALWLQYIAMEEAVLTIPWKRTKIRGEFHVELNDVLNNLLGKD